MFIIRKLAGTGNRRFNFKATFFLVDGQFNSRLISTFPKDTKILGLLMKENCLEYVKLSRPVEHILR